MIRWPKPPFIFVVPTEQKVANDCVADDSQKVLKSVLLFRKVYFLIKSKRSRVGSPAGRENIIHNNYTLVLDPNSFSGLKGTFFKFENDFLIGN